ncbi:MFS transporter [Candidatus Tisiphia endosymbiont of Ptychoptera albimana]|uniref:MFS transporter n=1 Tax=Candidatus Tisiphia endosymbiont of Ptychoptera albimana TaxID=3066260 RepID=UPI00312CBB8B
MDEMIQSKVLLTQTHLTTEQKYTTGLLLIGTFLEYFDLMLYIHLAILLNDLFFPKTDPQAASLLAALTFCLTYIFRPVGALIFGYIGDNIGYKATIVTTTFIMAISCIIIANLPVYDQIGIVSTWIIIIC